MKNQNRGKYYAECCSVLLLSMLAMVTRGYGQSDAPAPELSYRDYQEIRDQVKSDLNARKQVQAGEEEAFILLWNAVSGISGCVSHKPVSWSPFGQGPIAPLWDVAGLFHVAFLADLIQGPTFNFKDPLKRGMNKICVDKSRETIARTVEVLREQINEHPEKYGSLNTYEMAFKMTDIFNPVACDWDLTTYNDTYSFTLKSVANYVQSIWKAIPIDVRTRLCGETFCKGKLDKLERQKLERQEEKD